MEDIKYLSAIMAFPEPHPGWMLELLEASKSWWPILIVVVYEEFKLDVYH